VTGVGGRGTKGLTPPSPVPDPRPRTPRPLAAYLELAAAMAVFGSGIVVGKLVAASFPVVLAAGLTSAVALVVLGPMLLAEGWPSPRRRDLAVIFLQALIGSVLWRVLLFEGLRRTSVVESGIISSTLPAAIGLVSFLFLRERLAFGAAVGIALSVVGVMVVNLVGAASGVAGAAEAASSRLLGNLLILGSVVCDAMFSIFGKVAAARVSPLAIATLVNLLGLLLFAPFALWELGRFDVLAVPLAGWAAVVYFGVAGSAIVFVLWMRGVARVPASTAGVFTAVMPISALALSYLFLGEPFAWPHLVGLGFVLAGIWLVTRRGTPAGGSAQEPRNAM
jgi:drug/metabolite transporter (DMT)-like permease